MMMAYENFKPEMWAKEILKTFHQNSVMASLVNREFEGTIKQEGDVVHIRSFGNVTVRDYTRDSAITYETLNDPMQTLTINQQKYFAFKIDDLDNAQSDVDIAEGYAKQAAIAVREVADAHLYNHYTEALTANVLGASTPIALDKSTVYDQITILAEKLDNNNIPQEDRSLLVNPKVKRLLLQSDEFTRATSLGDATIQNGFIGNVAGFKVHVSNVVPVESCDVYPILAFHKDFITFASQVSNVEHVRPTDMFAHAVRGLYLYGSKVIRPEAGAVLKCTV